VSHRSEHLSDVLSAPPIACVSRNGALFSEHAQRTVLGAALIDNAVMRGPLANLSLVDLLGSQDQIIYEVMLELSSEGETFSSSTIVQILEDRGLLEQAGGVAYIGSLIDGVVPQPELVKRHVESIQRRAHLRRFQTLGEQLIQAAVESGADPSAVFRDLASKVNKLQAGCDLSGDLLPNELPNMARRPEILTLAQVEAREVDWLWKPYLANQTLAMLSGDPGIGKTFITLAISAALTIGREPFSGKPRPPAQVLYLSLENEPHYVVRPRMDALGGDVSHFHILRGTLIGNGETASRGSIKLSDVQLIADAIDKTQAGLIIVDPIQSYLGTEVDAHRSNETRPILDALAQLAERKKCCVLFVRHLGKAQAGKAIYRGLGSIDLTGAVRTELLAGSASGDPDMRALVQVKSNLGEFGPALGYAVDNKGFRWTGESNLTSDELLSPDCPGKDNGAMDDAVDFLQVELGQGARKVDELEGSARQAGIALRTLKRAKAKLSVSSRKRSMQEGWEWSLPEGGQK
jgi:hypothetical protein